MARPVNQILERVTQLPPSPVVVRILELTRSDKTSARDLAEVIARDQAFTARVLRMVNSAYYGLAQKVTTVSRAVAVLGFDTIKSLALTLYTFGPLRQEEGEPLSLGCLWEHCLGCALGARRIATRIHPALAEEAFVAGLLHDIGKVLFYQYFRTELFEALREAQAKGLPLSETEAQILGLDHATAGELWACRGNFPPLIRQVIRFHHTPLLVPEEEVDLPVRKTIALVHVADLFCEEQGIGRGGDQGEVLEGVWPLLGLSQEECEKLLLSLAEEVERTRKLFGLEEERAPHRKPSSPAASPSRQVGTKREPRKVETLATPWARMVEASQRIALLAGFKNLLPNLAAEARSLAEADAASVLVPCRGGFVVAEVSGWEELRGQTLPAQGSLVGWVTEVGEAVVVPNLYHASPCWEREFFISQGYLAHLFLPIEWAGKRLAVLSLHSRWERHWSAREVGPMSAFAGLAAVALENARLYREVEERAKALEDLNEELEKAFDLKRKFLATISHELRTPLQVIMGYAQLMEEGALGEITGSMQETLRTILRESGNLQNLIETLLDLSRLNAGQADLCCGWVRLEGLLSEVAARARTLLRGRPVELRCLWDASLPPLWTDRERLRQMLDRLLDNAVKFTPQGEVVLQAQAKGEGVEITVRDTGMGIAPKDQEIIFDAFCQAEDPTTRRFSGAGMGLYMVRRLLDLLGGNITAESEVGCGSTFRIWLPLGREREQQEELSSTLPPL